MKAVSISTCLGAVLLLAPVSASLADNTVFDQVKERGVLRVCHTDYPPLNIKDPTTNNWTGLLVEMVERYGASIKVKVEHVDSTWGTVIQNVKSGRCDISAASTFVTAERAKQALFTDTVTEDSQAAFVKTDSPFKSYADLDKSDKQVVVVSGSVNEGNAKATFKNATIRPIITDRQQSTALEVASGRADGAFISVLATKNFLAANKNIKVRPVDDTVLFAAPIAWLVAPGEAKMQESVNAWLKSARADGTLGGLEKKWLRDAQ
jgi:ABC-type amino acid transport substrate-binding protein